MGDPLRDAERTLYLVQRTRADVRSIKRGRLPARLARRAWHRQLFRWLRRMGL